ncbi:efflux RND transporter permease subunit [Alteribacter natronophilus]|uniref:efflux RND transporter permease subunit n=1 Tax=Alteribacter natronophilus TaxID=2583810 RepID=UPI00110DCA70|nr:efflux RND transporter permease subunit [Alteribacter natronophilus]TMW69890.1 efflux RND transporter permease subunit [Alteribacter natronophilus]
MGVLMKLVERKILIGLMVTMVVVFGFYGLSKLDRELMPQIDFNYAVISANAGDMSVLDVEERVTAPIEQILAGTDGVEGYQSSTTAGNSSIFIEIEEGRTQEVTRELEGRVAALESSVSGLNFVHVMALSTNQDAEFFMEVSGGDLAEMTDFARNVVKPRLESLSSVREVVLSGIQESEFVIEFDNEALSDNGLELQQVTALMQQENTETTLGELTEEENGPALRWNTAFQSADDLRAVTIPSMNGPVKLDDLAEVSEVTNQRSAMAWKDGTRDFIFMEISRAEGYTQIGMAEDIRGEVDEIRAAGLVSGFGFNEVVNQADYVVEALDGVTQNVLIGGVLALLILLLFLRNFRATVVAGVAIPVSVLLTFTSMWLFGYSFNIITLIALGLGIGMMVDASIVILESVYRKKEQGFTGMEAVSKGVREVATAVIASMLTTIVVFVPVGLFGGEVGQFVLLLSMVIVITLVSSVIVSFTLIPALSENFLKLRKKDRGKGDKRGPITQGYGSLIGWISSRKRRRYSMIFLFFLVFAGSMALTAKVPVTIMPDVYNRYAEVPIELEGSLSPSERQEIAEAIGEKLETVPDVESSFLIDDPAFMFMLVNMTTGDNVTTPQDEVNVAINEAIRDLEDDYPIKAVGMMEMGAAGGEPVQLRVKGSDFTEARELGGKLVSELEAVEGLVNVRTSVEETREERMIVFDNEAMEEAGITRSEIFGRLQGVFGEMPAGEVVRGGETIPVTVKSSDTVTTESDLAELEIMTAAGSAELSEFVGFETVTSPVMISRDNGERFVSVSAGIEGRDLGSVTRDVQQVIGNLDVPSGLSVSTGGDVSAQQEMMMELMMVVAISIFLVYVVMAVQFNSLAHPLIVMSIIPMTAIGAVLALLITQRELSMLSAMGLLMLIGIVLNNAILLIDRTKQLRNEGMTAEDAVKEAGQNRIRPIFMTTLTTVAGMLPLAIATGTASSYQAPLATVIIGGLLFATLITLVLIPSVYLLFEDVKHGFRGLFRKVFGRRKNRKPAPVEEAS